MASTAEKKQPVVLTTQDDEEYTVERNVAERSVLIKGMIEGESVLFLLGSLHPTTFLDHGPVFQLGRQRVCSISAVAWNGDGDGGLSGSGEGRAAGTVSFPPDSLSMARRDPRPCFIKAIERASLPSTLSRGSLLMTDLEPPRSHT